MAWPYMRDGTIEHIKPPQNALQGRSACAMVPLSTFIRIIINNFINKHIVIKIKNTIFAVL